MTRRNRLFVVLSAAYLAVSIPVLGVMHANSLDAAERAGVATCASFNSAPLFGPDAAAAEATFDKIERDCVRDNAKAIREQRDDAFWLIPIRALAILAAIFAIGKIAMNATRWIKAGDK